MHNLPFDKPGTFWKGNLHCHSTLSDGDLGPEEVCQVYKNLGYDFLSITDHFRARNRFPLADTRPFRTDTFTTIIGAELHSGKIESGTIWHILANGLPFDFAPPPDGETGPDLAARAMDAGAFVSVAHPNWYTLTPDDVVKLGDVHAIEVFNGTSYNSNDRAWSMEVARIMLMRGGRYTLCATDDAHLRKQRPDVGMGWVHVKAEALEPDALVTALKAGHYYSSTGPQIFDLHITPGESVHVECSPVERIFLTGPGKNKDVVGGQGIRSATLSLKPFEGLPWAMVTVRDQYGNRAWTNPIWFD